MVIDTDTVISVLCQVAGDEQIKLTVRNALKGAVISGSGSFVGALIAGQLVFLLELLSEDC